MLFLCVREPCMNMTNEHVLRDLCRIGNRVSLCSAAKWQFACQTL